MINPNEYIDYMVKLQEIRGILPYGYTKVLLKKMEGYSLGKIRNAMSGLSPDWQVLQAAQRIAEVQMQINALQDSIAA